MCDKPYRPRSDLQCFPQVPSAGDFTSYSVIGLQIPHTGSADQESVSVTKYNVLTCDVNSVTQSINIQISTFKLINSPIEQVYSYQYLGVNISYTGKLKQASIDLSGKATKALFGLNARVKEYSTLNVDTLLKLFDTLIQPILTYASEIWISDFKLDFLNDKYPFELVHLKSCKLSLGVHNKTSNLAVKCELSSFPI